LFLSQKKILLLLILVPISGFVCAFPLYGSGIDNHGQPKEGCVHLLVHFVGKGIAPLLNIDPDRYSYVDLVDDICGLNMVSGCKWRFIS
jgi:hypothetical protein